MGLQVFLGTDTTCSGALIFPRWLLQCFLGHCYFGVFFDLGGHSSHRCSRLVGLLFDGGKRSFLVIILGITGGLPRRCNKGLDSRLTVSATRTGRNLFCLLALRVWVVSFLPCYLAQLHWISHFPTQWQQHAGTARMWAAKRASL
jgi:hypothetical protein